MLSPGLRAGWNVPVCHSSGTLGSAAPEEAPEPRHAGGSAGGVGSNGGGCMPLNIVVGLIALLVALVLYSLGTWGAFRAKTVTRRHVTYLWIGLAFDVLATAMMAIAAGGLDLEPMADLLHTVIAFVAMFGMLAAAVMGTRALAASNESALRVISKWIVAPWAVWVLMFLWGMASRGSQRM